MYKLEFTLKQHTPIIHFQHDQDGATLRATEVKPKLDRFILMKLGNGDYEKGRQDAKNKGWLINEEKGALDYKMRFINLSEKISINIDKSYPNYLGNMGTSVDKKQFVFVDNVQVVFICNIDLQLIQTIDKYFSMFLCCTNFGNRNNKGFGCYLLNDLKINEFENNLKNNFKTVFKRIWKNEKVNIQQDHKFLFRKIQDEYKLIKAGDSRTKKESKLRLYVNSLSNPIEWEKPVIKMDLSKITRQNLNINWKNKNFHYVRGLLGIADHFEFIQLKATAHFEPENINLERFASPIFFKVFNTEIYIMPNSNTCLEKIEGNKFLIKYKVKKEENKIVKNELSIPNIKFDLDKFLIYALNNTSWTRI